MVSYCSINNESYSEPYLKLSFMSVIELLLVPICILPYGHFLKFWLFFRTLVAISIAVLTPIDLLMIGNPLHLIKKILLGTNIIAYIDLYLMLLVGHFGEKGQLITHPLKNALHYLSGGFIKDFLFCFPWEIILKIVYTKCLKQDSCFLIYWLLSMIKMGQIYKLSHLIDYFQKTSNENAKVRNLFIITLKNKIL